MYQAFFGITGQSVENLEQNILFVVTVQLYSIILTHLTLRNSSFFRCDLNIGDLLSRHSFGHFPKFVGIVHIRTSRASQMDRTVPVIKSGLLGQVRVRRTEDYCLAAIFCRTKPRQPTTKSCQ